MQRVVDPEFDERQVTEPGVCPTGRCDGSGWCSVSEAYVDRWAGPPPSIPEGETPLERAAFEEAHHWYQCKRAAFRRSSYPCPSCMPRQFERWSGDHWGRHHDRDGCADCRRVDAESGKKTRGRHRKTEPKIVGGGDAPAGTGEAPPAVEPEPVSYETEAML